MASPQPSDAHLRLAHSILEQLIASDFSKRQLYILLFILRLSWGCGKKYALIPKQKDFEIAGIGAGKIKPELDVLVRDKVLNIEDDKYSFNKDFDQWRISRARGYSFEDMAGLISLNIDYYQRDVLAGVPLKLENPVNLDDVDIMTTWQSVPGFKLSGEQQFQLLDKLRKDFPDLDILTEVKKWSARKMADPLKKTSKVQSQIYNWMVKAREFNGNHRKPNQVPKGHKTKGMEAIE